MFFPISQPSRTRQSFVSPQALPALRFNTARASIPFVCSSAPPPPPPSVPPSPQPSSTPSASNPSPTPSPPSSVTAVNPDDPQSPAEAQFAERLDTARQRARQLYARLLTRLVETATQRALAALSCTLSENNDFSQTNGVTSNTTKTAHFEGTPPAEVARRLRRDLRALRATLDDGLNVSDIALTASIDSLRSLVEQVEQMADVDAFTAAQDKQQGGETLDGGGNSSVGDTSAEYDANSPRGRLLRWQRAAGLRRKVSGVGEAIEGSVAEFVRNDGSIDVDGLRGVFRRMLDSISMTWMRLNGRTPSATSVENGDVGAAAVAASAAAISAQASVSLRDEEREFDLREQIGQLEKELIESSRKRENTIRREDQLGKLIRAREIRLMDDSVSALRRTLAVRVLQLELEKIFIGVADEIDSTEYESLLEQRVLVVEFGDLNERLTTLDLFVEQREPLLIEDDTLGELAADIQDMKMRLGLDGNVYSSAELSWDQVRQFMTSSSKKARDGFDFYSRGLRLFVGDLVFAWRLVSRTVTGYTPSAREIRTLRRTGRDLLTLVPFTIVLIAPLTPVGHVLIFSFLQRYWPEFFPSTFSERRQVMMKKREQYLKMVEEDEGEDGNDTERKKVRGGGGVLQSVRKAVSERFTGRDDKVEDGKNEEGNNVVGDVGQSSVLDELADQVRDGDKIARKKRIFVALDELHLAD